MWKWRSWLDTGRDRLGGRRHAWAALLAAAAVSLGLTLAPAQSPDPPSRQSFAEHDPVVRPQRRQEDSINRIREGTELVNQPGYFRVVDDRVTFAVADGSKRFVTLENLNLERVVHAISANPGQLEWSVSGVVTEYQQSNYLLVRRAVLASKPSDRASKRP